MSPLGRYSRLAQGASPGLIIGTSFFEPPTGAALPRRRANARAESAAPTELLFFLSMFTQGSVRAFGTLATLGFAGVSCLKALVISLNVDKNTASAAQCNSIDL